MRGALATQALAFYATQPTAFAAESARVRDWLKGRVAPGKL